MLNLQLSMMMHMTLSVFIIFFLQSNPWLGAKERIFLYYFGNFNTLANFVWIVACQSIA